jgi:dTDP-4-dehydrorhamnose reductase
MKVWIVGSQGLLGKEVERLCKEEKIDFISTSRKEADICELTPLLRLASMEAVTHIINCAAFTNVDAAEKEAQMAYRINAMGPENLGIVGHKIGAKVVHVSTDYVFDGQKNEPYEERDQCKPLGVYAHSKWMGENRLLEQLPTACIVRCSWLFGKNGKNFLSSLLSRLSTDEELRIASDQTSKVTYTRDLAKVLLALLCHSGIFHFANQGELSRFQMAEVMFEEAKKRKIPLACRSLVPILSAELTTQAIRPSYSVLSTEKIERVLGKSPRKWQETVHEYLQT